MAPFVEARKSVALPGKLFTIALAGALLFLAIPVEAAQFQVLPGHIPQGVASARPVGRLGSQIRLNLAIGLPLRHQGELDLLLKEITDPASINYRHFLTPEQFAAEFGPTPSDYQALIAFAEANHLAVTGTHPNRTLLDVSGEVGDIERTFHIYLVNYSHPTRGEFYAPDREPSLDLDVKALDISGLDNFEPPHPMALKTRPLNVAAPYVTGSGPAGYFIGKDFRAAYAPGVTLTGSGQTIGLLEFDGFYSGDVQKNFTQAGLPPVPTQTVLLDGFSGLPGGANIEVMLDIMMASYMAPGLSKVIVYEGSNPNDILNRMATDNLAQQLSSSWGFSPINATTEQIFKQYIAQGQSALQASGDSGAYKGPIMPPSDDPNLTVVGGTSLTTSGAGGPWQSESVWPGSGGGISTSYPIPSYQQGSGMAANLAAAGGSLRMRNIPDVALTADIQMFLIQNNGQAVAVGGTSAAAPLWAGFIALANQQAATNSKPRVGFLNPIVYSIGGGASYAADFNDISRGSNNGFSAVTAFDLTTGWGTPAGQHLIYDLTGTSGAPGFSLSASSSALSITQGSTGSVVVTVSQQYGFSSAVNLAVTGLPTGVTASFAPAQAAKTSTLTLTASTSAAPGTYSLLITGTSGTLSSSTPVALSIVAPGFSLSSSVSPVTVPRSSTASTIVGVTARNGFNGAVTLAATGLPTGVSAIFSPATTSTTSSLAFSANAAAAPGTYAVTVTGTSGALKATETISVVVTAPGFTLSVVPGNLGLPRGFTANGTVTITPQGGFSGNVTMAATGLPAGVTATFALARAIRSAAIPSPAIPSPAVNSFVTRSAAANPSTVVSFAATSTAAAGSYPVTLTGTAGPLSNRASFTLTVIAPPAATAFVNLLPAYNITALAADGVAFNGGGLDGGLNGTSTAYSATLIGVQQSIAGTLFYFGPANALDAVTSKTIALPGGQYASLKVLAAAVNGNQPSQKFSVAYTDGSVSTFSQSLSDWFSPQNYPGEFKAMIMPYRNTGGGVRDNRTFFLYEYSLPLNPNKKLSSITLPNNRNVVVLAASPVTSTASVRR